MGVESRKGPPLPAPTETDSNTGREETELESRVTHQTDKTTYSLPSDGSPVTISTKKRDKGQGLTSSKSQTSLLIEYFEGGKDGKLESRRPSVRVKVTPSSKSSSRSANDHIQITERKGARKPSYTKRIQLSPHVKGDKSPEGDADDNSLLSYRSATEESNVTSRGGGPIEVEIMPRRHTSPLIPTGASNSRQYVQQNASDISSMPADSFLDGKTRSPERKRSRSLSRGEVLVAGATTGLVAGAVADKLRTPSHKRSRSLSRERIVVQKAVEKVRSDKSERRRKHRSISRSISGEQLTEGLKSPRRRSSRSHHDDSTMTGANSSFLSSQVSGRSGDQSSIRSGNSRVSINNPKLLETVEDAIRRLILPELTALKRDQSQHLEREQRDRRRRGSVTSGSGVSRDSVEEYSTGRRLSDRGSHTDLSSKPRVILNDGEILSGNSAKSRKEKNKILDQVKLEDSPGRFERETSEETVIQDGERSHKRKKSRALEAAAMGAGVGALTAAALHNHQSQDSLNEKKERRRRRTKSNSRSDNLAESHEEREPESVPPMPLMSDINASEVTRSSILSAATERPHSASQEYQVTPIKEVPRGIASPAPVTPTRTPVALQQGLGTQHSNYSRGNLSLHSQPSEPHLYSQEYDLDDHGRKVPMRGDHGGSYLEEEPSKDHGNPLAAGLVGAGLAAIDNRHKDHYDHDDPELTEDDEQYNYYQNHQEVPPPLRYVPYGHERRGLSPIQSVSGYTEGDPDQQRDSRLTHSTGSYSSLGKSAQHKHSRRSITSLDSTGNVRGYRHDFADVRQGGLTDSELTQDGEYWEEQHRENDRNRDIDADSYRSSDPRIDYKHMTNFTDDSMDAPELDRITAGQNVKGVGANPDYVHTPLAVESAVASLVNESELTSHSGHYDRRDSDASFEDGSERHFTSRGNSPSKRDTFGASQATSSQPSSPSRYAEEYDIDELGRKVAIPKYKKSHTKEKSVLAGIAAGAAAHVLAGRNGKSEVDQIQYEDVNAKTGAPLQKSFKERAMESQGQVPLSPRSIVSESASQDQIKLGATGIPDAHDPMPEIGYGNDAQSEVDTNPSIIQGPIGGAPAGSRDHWPGYLTPPKKQQEDLERQSPEHDPNLKAAEAALVGAAVGAGATAAIAGHNRNLSRESNDDEWQRTSGDRKRDTLITNPYEGTSPIAAIGDGLDRDLLGVSHGFGPPKLNYQIGSPGPVPKDEGYISSAPNARSPGAISPEQGAKGVNFLDQELGGEDEGGDPFYTPKHTRHLSGMSQGMDSAFYDSATGNGMDRIQSKDIVALMDHLTVRDAQRSARDTEILVTLVRAAAEMRNSFLDMKRLLADTEDQIIREGWANTDYTVGKVINGPRPLPASAARSLKQGSQDEMFDDIPAKRRNVFRRALKGLSMKSSNDLGKIEEMLVQLLGDVEGLKAAQGLRPGSHRENSYDELRQEGNYENDHGYEPEGNAGTSTASHASQSGHLSLPLSSRGPSATRGFDGRKFSDHRISTVPEGDEEELDDHEEVVLSNQFENNEELLTPIRENLRGSSAPLGTPPQQVPLASLSNENTPKTDKSKKHKSSSSSGWIPKVSRWSETTASTVFKGFRSSGRSSGKKDNDQFAEPPSRSGSDLGNYDNENDPYGEDRLQYSPDRNQPLNEPVSLLPPEDPKYKAHRNSLNLQHPQPRPGPTHRYQTALESKAQNFDTPMSPASANWSQTSLNVPPPNTHRYSDGATNIGRISVGSDGGYSNGSASNQPPARPPKEPVSPELPPKIRTGKLQKPSPLSNEHLSPERTYSTGGGVHEQSESPRIASRSLSATLGGVPTRKPTGPRSMSSVSKSGELNRDDGTIRRNKNRGTFGTVASNHSGESETF